MTSQYVCAAAWAWAMHKRKPGKFAKVASVHCVWYTLSFVFLHLLLGTAEGQKLGKVDFEMPQ